MSIQKAGALRKSLTNAERLLWRHLRNRQLEGFKIRRQHPIGPYIVDFICLDKKLIIELDGGQHADRIDYDGRRTQYFETMGYRVIKFWNNEILRQTDSVLTAILKEITLLLTPTLSPSGRGSIKQDWYITFRY